MHITRQLYEDDNNTENLHSLTKYQKDLLISEMVRNVDFDDGTSSKIEVAFDLLVLRGIALSGQSTGIEKLDVEDLEEFAEHCALLCEDISRRRESPTEIIYDDTALPQPNDKKGLTFEDDEDVDDQVDDELLLALQEKDS